MGDLGCQWSCPGIAGQFLNHTSYTMLQREGPRSHLCLQSLACKFPLLCKDSDEGVIAQFPCCCSRSSVGVLLSPIVLHDELSPPPDFYVKVLTNSQFLCKCLGKDVKVGTVQ